MLRKVNSCQHLSSKTRSGTICCRQMIPLSETLKKKEYKRKKRKPKEKQKFERNPFSAPSQYLYYGRGAYVVLCYASMRSRMRDREWFTANDYIKFQVDRFNMKQVSAMCARLNSCGYLIRRPIIVTKKLDSGWAGKMYEYHITDLGLLALSRLAQIHKRKIADDE